MADNFTPTTFVPQGGESSGSKVPSFLRMLASPVIPQLSDVAGQLRDSALSDMRQAAGPEAATNSAVKKLLYGAKSVGETGLAGAADLGGAMTPSDIVAGGLGPKVAGPYYAARGAAGGIQSAQKAAAEPSPENVQRALQDFGVAFLGAHGAAKAYSGEPTATPETPPTLNPVVKSPQPSIPGLMQHAQNVADIVRERGGATYNMAEGDRTGQNQYGVAMMPERDRKVAGEVTPQSVASFMQDNADIYANNPRANVGVWNAPDKNHYLEVSSSTHDLNNALDVAKRHNQYAIYDLKNGRDIPTGGTGGVTDAPPLDEDLRAAANDYNAQKGLPQISGSYLQTDPRAKAIADAYSSMQHTPNDPATAHSYAALQQDITDQFHYAQNNMGMKFEPWTGQGQPYANSADMAKDVRNNHHLFFFQGGDIPAGNIPDHPMSQVDNTTGLTFNDEFRAVHDLFGHAQSGFEFGPRGEENAWHIHKQMMSPDAVPAMTSETKGQNSWNNFGQHLRRFDGSIPKRGDSDYVPMQERPFAEQKAGLLPPEFQSRGEVSRLDEVTPSPEKTPLSLRHYSETPVKGNILSGARRGISPDGSTIRNVGAEGQRVTLGKGAPQGVYFYKEGGQGEPQIVSRPYEYAAQGNYALADLKDNDVFHNAVQKAFQRIKSEESSIPGLSAKQAPISDAEAHLRAINEGEHALQAAGYDGYTNTSPDAHNQHIVFLFGDHKVGPVIPDAPPAPKRVMPASLLTNPQAGATVMPASIIERVLPRSEADRAQSAITKAGGQYQGPWGFEAAGQPEQYAFTDPATGSTLAAGSKELKPALLAEKMAKSRLDMLTSDEKARLGPRNVKQFSDTLAGLPAVSEMENVAKAGLVGKDWYPNARAAFAQLQRVSPDYFRTGDEIKFANVIGSTSPNQPVEVNIREGLGVWKRWVDAGRPTDAKSVHKLLTNIPMNELTQAGAKVPNLTSSLMGQDLFTGRKAYFKAPSFGEALGGNDESFVGDTHMADAYGLNPAATFKSPRLYYAMAANTRAVARKLNISTSAAQASIWAATVALKNAIGAEPDATPSELASIVTPERIASEMKDMADIMLKDSESRAMIKSMLPKGVSLDAFDEGLKAIVQGRQAGTQRQGTAAARGVEALARRLKGSGKMMRNLAGSFTHDDDTSFDYR